MKVGTHSLGKNRHGNTIFVKVKSNGDLQLQVLSTMTFASEINFSAEQAQLLKDVL